MKTENKRGSRDPRTHSALQHCQTRPRRCRNLPWSGLGAGGGLVFSAEWGDSNLPTAFSSVDLFTRKPQTGPEHLGVLSDTRASLQGWSGLYRNISLYNGAGGVRGGG